MAPKQACDVCHKRKVWPPVHNQASQWPIHDEALRPVPLGHNREGCGSLGAPNPEVPGQQMSTFPAGRLAALAQPLDRIQEPRR